MVKLLPDPSVPTNRSIVVVRVDGEPLALVPVIIAELFEESAFMPITIPLLLPATEAIPPLEIVRVLPDPS